VERLKGEEDMMQTGRAHLWAVGLLLWSSAILGAGGATAQVPALLRDNAPRPSNLGEYIRDEGAAIVLGKALFWDMQVGSDGVQACATCHFRAGADTRKKNQVSPGLLRVVFGSDEQNNPTADPAPDYNFDGQGPNDTLRREDYPFLKLQDPRNRESTIVSNNNNVVSSAGVHHAIFGQSGYPGPDPDRFYVGTGSRRANVRRVEPRNTPTMINAVFNFSNFWDGRANHFFNGRNPFGASDPDATLYRADDPESPLPVQVLIDNSSLASQASGPPTNDKEMSAIGRTFPDVGRQLMQELGRRHRFNALRLLAARPLALQLVHRNDSVLGPHSRAPFRGLNVTYDALIRQAFQPRWWASPRLIQVAEDGTTTVVNQRDGNPATDEFTLMEYNFSLFFSLAVQAYESTLVSDDTPFDRFLRDSVSAPLSPAAERGRRIFFNLNPASPPEVAGPRGNCAFCHSGSLLSEASVESIAANGRVRQTGNPVQFSDRGTRAIGVRAATEDLGAGADDPFGNPLSFAAQQALPSGAVLAVDGTFKIPGLRNVALTAPYFHTGGEATLLDVINFYARGGNLGGATNPILTRDDVTIGGLSVLNFNVSNGNIDSEAAKADLVAFLEALTDERVRRAAAPFDHPQLFVPNGHPGNDSAVIHLDHRAVDTFLMIPAVGRAGADPLPGFLEE
jgi:cytochrome c peroxidase